MRPPGPRERAPKGQGLLSAVRLGLAGLKFVLSYLYPRVRRHLLAKLAGAAVPELHRGGKDECMLDTEVFFQR